MPDGRRRAVQAEWRSAEQLQPRDMIYAPPFDRWTRIRTVAHRGAMVHLSTDLGLIDFRRRDLVRVVPGGPTTSLYPNPMLAIWAANMLRQNVLRSAR